MTQLNSPITLRLATPDDYRPLARLAALDSSDSIPPGRVLLGEVEGELRAALSLADGSAIADPFHPTLHLLGVLRAHASEAAMHRRPRRLRRLKPSYVLR